MKHTVPSTVARFMGNSAIHELLRDKAQTRRNNWRYLRFYSRRLAIGKPLDYAELVRQRLGLVNGPHLQWRAKPINPQT